MARTTVELKQHLFDAYGGFADKRYKDINRDAPFIVDDRGDGDYDARGQLFLWFCQMFLQVMDGTHVKLTLRGGTPDGPEVKEWFAQHDAEHKAGGVEFEITPNNVDDLLALAASFQSITGRRYDTKAYKYVVPRVVDSLHRLHGILRHFWD